MFSQLTKAISTRSAPTKRKQLPRPKTDMLLAALKTYGPLTVALAADKTGLSITTTNSIFSTIAKHGELRVTRKRSHKREAVVNWYGLIEGETK